MKKGILILILCAAIFIVAAPAFAVSWWPIVQCGLNKVNIPGVSLDPSFYKDCTRCDLFKLFKNLIDLLFFVIVPAVGVLLFLLAGFLILIGSSGGNSKLVQRGKSMFSTTFFGILIILGAWLMTSFLIKSITGSDQVQGTPWYEIQCTDSGTTSGPPGGKLYACDWDTLQCAEASDGDYSTVEDCNADCVSSEPSECGDMNAVCTSSSCKPFLKDPMLPSGKSDWTYLVSEVASTHAIPGANTVNFLTAIMKIESQGRLNQQSASSPPSCGLMQMQAPTAQMFASKCGISHEISCSWLRGQSLFQGETVETVAKASICMSAEYAKSIASSRCYGGQLRDIAAGYNGGDGCNQDVSRDNALALSKTCTVASTANPKYDTDCSNRPTLRYECVFNNLAHTTCNTGFKETRNYVQQFNACYQ